MYGSSYLGIFNSLPTFNFNINNKRIISERKELLSQILIKQKQS